MKNWTIMFFLMFCFISSVQAEVGLVGWWKFDEGSGDILHDSSGKGNDGKIDGAAWVKGNKGSALLFDGVDDYVSCGNDVSLHADGPLTVSAWAKVFSAPNVRGQIVSKQSWILGVKRSEIMPTFEVRNATNDESYDIAWGTGIPTDKWFYMAVVCNVENKVIEIYINSELKVSFEWPDGAIFGCDAVPLQIGRESMWGGSNFTGLIGEIKIYDRALTSEKIKENYQSELETKDESLNDKKY